MNKRMKYILTGGFLFGGLFLLLIYFADFLDSFWIGPEMLYGMMDMNEWFGDPGISYAIWSIIWAILGGVSGYGKYKGRKSMFILPIILFALINIFSLLIFLMFFMIMPGEINFGFP